MSENMPVMHHRQQELTAEIARLRREKEALVEALEIIAGKRRSPYYLMENQDIARAALRSATETKDGQS